MSGIERWLEAHGLEKYAGLFVENEIDLEVLPELEEADLKDLDVPLGARKKILKAIREFEFSEAISSSAETAENSKTLPGGEAERRQLTVMFCDLVGSTAFSESMDTEDYRELLSAYQTAAAGVIREHEGYIARYMGDGLLVYFGYPTAQENDPERAARAGLAIIDAVSSVNSEIRGTLDEAEATIATGDLADYSPPLMKELANEERENSR